MSEQESEETPRGTEWVTIAEAARRLGLIERQARRWAERLPADARRQEEIAAGRTRALVQLAALQAIVGGADSVRSSDRTSDRTLSGQVAEAEEATTMAVPLGLAMAAQRDALERVMKEKERVIAEQAARISDLQTALEHEREAGKRTAEALAREQMLRSLPPPEKAVEAPESSRGVGSGSVGPKRQGRASNRGIRAFLSRAWPLGSKHPQRGEHWPDPPPEPK